MSTDPAVIVFDYLNLRSSQAPTACDVIIGFGHFDQRIARHCGQLWQAGVAPRVLFTGGRGAGSADLDRPEAEAFAQSLRRSVPELPAAALLLETASTHTGDNIRLLQVQAQGAHWPLHSVTLVASPYRMRRVALTWRQQGPGGAFLCSPPPTTFAEERALFQAKGEDLVAHLSGEIGRLTAYAERGWIAPEPIPLAVAAAAAQLVRR